MNHTDTSVSSRFSRLWRTLVGEVVEIVPDEVACCEFNCRRGECNFAEWVDCERRLKYVTKSHTADTVCEQDAAASK